MLWIAVFGILGLAVGSFLNVVILRLPIMLKQQWEEDCRQCLNLPTNSEQASFNLLTPRSHCPQCKTPLTIFENIPVLSFIFLRGRCRTCHLAISWRYPLIELLTAFLTILTAYHFGLSYHLIGYLFLAWSLIVLTVIDFDHFILPDQITLLLVWLGLAFNLITNTVSLHDAVLGAILGYLFLYGVYWIFKALTGKEGIGYGDFKLLAALGAWFGWQSLTFILLASSAVGALVGIFCIIFLKRSRSLPIPYGPYLAAAGWIYMIWGDKIMKYYQQIILEPL